MITRRPDSQLDVVVGKTRCVVDTMAEAEELEKNLQEALNREPRKVYHRSKKATATGKTARRG